MKRCFRGRSCLRKTELLQQLLLQVQHGLRRRERFAGHEKDVLHAIAERIDARRLQADVVLRQDARDAVEQARPVARDVTSAGRGGVRDGST